MRLNNKYVGTDKQIDNDKNDKLRIDHSHSSTTQKNEILENYRKMKNEMKRQSVTSGLNIQNSQQKRLNNQKNSGSNHHATDHLFWMISLRKLLLIICSVVALVQSHAPTRRKFACALIHAIYLFIDDNLNHILGFVLWRLSTIAVVVVARGRRLSENRDNTSGQNTTTTAATTTGNYDNNGVNTNGGETSKSFSASSQRRSHSDNNNHDRGNNNKDEHAPSFHAFHVHLLRSLYLCLMPLYSYYLLGVESPVWLSSFVQQQSTTVNLSLVTSSHWSIPLLMASLNVLSTMVGMLCLAPRWTAHFQTNESIWSYSVGPVVCLICSMLLVIRICEYMKQIAMMEREHEKAKALIQSEIMYHKMYKDAPCLFITVNRTGVILNCNKAVHKLTCRSEEDLIGSSFYSLLTPESQSILRNVLVICGTTNSKKDVVINNIELEMKGGYINYHHHHSSSSSSSDDGSPLFGGCGSGGGGGGGSRNRSSSVHSHNGCGGSGSFGGSGSDDDDFSFGGCCSSADGDRERMRKRRRSMNSAEDVCITSDNYVIHHMLASITKTYQHSEPDQRSLSNLVYNIVLQDMSENNMTQHQLKLAKEEAEEANRTKSMFLNSMSHELRTPLTAIVGLSEILLMDHRLCRDQLEVVKSISSSSVVLRTLISDILDLSKVEAGRCQLDHYPFDLQSALETVDRLTRTSALEKQLDYTFQVDSQVPRLLMGDVMRLNQILLNLCNNCIKFTHRGSVTVSVTGDHSSLSPYMQNHIPKYHTNRPDQIQLFFSVADTGIGIPANKIRDLFQPFTQVQAFETRFTGGTGLGLMISKSLVQLMKGHIAVSSKEGVGSTFTFSAVLGIDNNLTQKEKTDIMTTIHDTDSMQLRLNPCVAQNPRDLKVLVTDDNLINQRVLSKILQSLGISPDSIQFACDGRSAVDTYQRSNGNIDLIFMDLHMPVMDGFEATQHIRRVDSKTVIVCLTANATDQTKQKCEESGFSHYLSKPYTRSQIENILNLVKK